MKVSSLGINFDSVMSKRAALILTLLLGIAVYSVFGVHHLLHDHAPRLTRVALMDQAQHGRWFAPYVHSLTLHRDLAIYGQVLTVTLLLLTAVVMVITIGHHSRINLKSMSNLDAFLVFSTVVVFPFNLALFYYSWMSHLFAGAMLLAGCAVFFLLHRFWLFKALGVVLVTGAMATYQPAISVVFTLIAGAVALGAMLPREDATLRSLLAHFLAASMLGMLGALIYAGLTYLMIDETRVTRMISLAEYPDRVVEVTIAAFRHFWITQPELMRWPKIFMLALCGLGILSAIYYGEKRNVLRIFLFALCCLLTILATKTTFYISPDLKLFNYRYNLSYGVLFSIVLLVLIAGPRHIIAKVGGRALGIYLLWFCAIMDLNRQTILLRGEQHDRAIANRILARVESIQGIDYNQTYRLVRVGPYSTFRTDTLRASNGKWEVGADEHMDNGDIHNGWTPESMMRLLGSDIRYSSEIGAWVARIRAYRNFAIQQGRQPWPHKSSIFVAGTDIVIYMQ